MTGDVAVYAIAVGISIVPESLILVLTTTMAAGTRRMAKSNVIVRKTDALEALGGVSDICSDKVSIHGLEEHRESEKMLTLISSCLSRPEPLLKGR